MAMRATPKRRVSKSIRPEKGFLRSGSLLGGAAVRPAQRGAAFENDLIEARAQLLELRGMLDAMKQSQEELLKEIHAETAGRKSITSPRRQSLASHFSPQVGPRKSSGMTRSTLGKEETLAEKRVLNKLESYGQMPATASDMQDHPKFIAPDTCRARGNTVLMSRPVQSLFVSLIFVNVIWLAVEVDVPNGSSWYDTVSLVSYALTVTFFLEAVLNMMFVPHWWMMRDILIDAVLCVIVFALETLAFVGVLGDGLKWLTLLRCLRIVRFAWKLRRKNAGRPLRVLMTAASGCTWTFMWVALMLLLSFYGPALIARASLVGSNSTEVRTIVSEYFPSTPLAVVTFIHIFLGAFNYDAEIIRPLLHQPDLWPVGALLLLYGIFMIICASNFISGLFIEFILKAARRSDDLLNQELLSLRELSMEDLLRLYHRIDQDNEGFFGLDDFITAMDDDPELESALHVLSEKTREELEADPTQEPLTPDLMLAQHRRHTMYRDRDRELFFHTLDILGHGEVAFSDFVYGVMKSLTTPKSLEQLIFDYQFSKIVRMHGECWRATMDVQDYLVHHKAVVTNLSGKLGQDSIVHAADISHIHKSFVSLNDKLDVVCADISEESQGSQGHKVLTLEHAKKAMEMGGLLQQLADKMGEAMLCAEKQASQSANALATITGDFSMDVQRVARTELDHMQRHGKEASQRAATAAESGKRSRDKIAALLHNGQQGTTAQELP